LQFSIQCNKKGKNRTDSSVRRNLTCIPTATVYYQFSACFQYAFDGRFLLTSFHLLNYQIYWGWLMSLWNCHQPTYIHSHYTHAVFPNAVEQPTKILIKNLSLFLCCNELVPPFCPFSKPNQWLAWRNVSWVKGEVSIFERFPSYSQERWCMRAAFRLYDACIEF